MPNRTKVDFVSRETFKNMCPLMSQAEVDWIAISISDTNKELDEMLDWLEGSFLDSIALTFKDDQIGMTDDQAKQIITFINKYPNVNVLVHCFAGVSRSGAIAKFINEYYEYGHWYLEDYKGHNRTVFNQLHKAAGTSLIAYYEELEKQERRMKM